MRNARKGLLREAAEEIRQADSVLLACHVRPDADALGSLLGMLGGLERLGKRVAAVSPDGVPPVYRFLPGWERVVRSAEGPWDLAVGLDADGSDRLGAAEALVLAQPRVLDVDHHTGEPYGHVRLVDPTAAATGELVYELLVELGVPLTPGIADSLMAAILTDTGSFRFSNATANVFRVAADLVEAGAHPAPIYDAVYGTRSYAASRLLGGMLASLGRSPDGRVVWGSLSRADFEGLGLESDATEGFVDQIRTVEGSEVALFFREERNGEVRVSLRSRGGGANVARIAGEFGGGGHVPAAGCTLPGPLAEAERRVVEAAMRHLDES